MMHIFFEDYYKKYFEGRLSKELYYDLLEIVNFIVLNLPVFRKLTGWVSYAYEQHKERALHLQKVYTECGDMKEFCEKAVKDLREK